jgi:spore coat polysaccharide biosynthesis predicted glycosyltransferase SpsG
MHIDFRVDGGRIWGLSLGHVFRCLALAEHIQARSAADGKGATVRFVMKDYPEGVAIVRDRGHKIVTLPASIDPIKEAEVLAGGPAQVVVFDGIDLSEKRYERLERMGKRSIALDERGGWRLDADLGPAFAVLSSEFYSAPAERMFGAARRILLTFGGSDPAGLTRRVAEHLAVLAPRLRGVAVDLLLGPGYPIEHDPAVAMVAAGIEIRRHHNVTSVRPLMEGADIAVAAAGRTAYELAALGVPTVLVPSQEFECAVADTMTAVGAAVTVGAADAVDWGDRLGEELFRLLGDAGLRRQLSVTAQRLVDGRGAARVVDLILRGKTDILPTQIYCP